MADTTDRPADKKAAATPPSGPAEDAPRVTTQAVDLPALEQDDDALDEDGLTARDRARRNEIVSSPAVPTDAPFLSEGSRLDIEENGETTDPFTGKRLSRRDLP